MEIRRRIQSTYTEVLEEVRRNRGAFVWRGIRSVEELGSLRMAAMDEFLRDYQRGSDRYMAGTLPSLPFEDDAFDLALCSHLLFLYSGHLSLDFHILSIEAMCRVAREVKIFPLLELGGGRSNHLEGVMQWAAETGHGCEVEVVDYEFQKGGREMLHVWPRGRVAHAVVASTSARSRS